MQAFSSMQDILIPWSPAYHHGTVLEVTQGPDGDAVTKNYLRHFLALSLTSVWEGT